MLNLPEFLEQVRDWVLVLGLVWGLVLALQELAQE
jgi:hypothetical protein